jgi:hypothetical protein
MRVVSIFVNIKFVLILKFLYNQLVPFIPLIGCDGSFNTAEETPSAP